MCNTTQTWSDIMTRIFRFRWTKPLKPNWPCFDRRSHRCYEKGGDKQHTVIWLCVTCWDCCVAVLLAFKHCLCLWKKISMSALLIPDRHTTDFSVSFWDYLHCGSTLGVPVPFETCVHTLKCHKMSEPSARRSSMSLQRKKVKQHNAAMLTKRGTSEDAEHTLYVQVQ